MASDLVKSPLDGMTVLELAGLAPGIITLLPSLYSSLTMEPLVRTVCGIALCRIRRHRASN